jgi:hypothetical protein
VALGRCHGLPQLRLGALALGARRLELALQLLDAALRRPGAVGQRPRPLLGALQLALELGAPASQALQLGFRARQRRSQHLELRGTRIRLLRARERPLELVPSRAQLLAERVDLGLRRGRTVASTRRLCLDLGELGGCGLALDAELGLGGDGDESAELEGFGPSFAEELEELTEEIESGSEAESTSE